MLTLDPIGRNGRPQRYAGPLPPVATEMLRVTSNLYALVGYREPWIGYLVLHDDDVPVGTCGFKSPPSGGRVEIAYFTFPEYEGQGFASAMVAELLKIAQHCDASVRVAAQTLPAADASHRVLQKLGFEHVETLEHPDDGVVWEWQWSTRR